MIRRLRIQLTLWFFFLVMVAYILAGMASFWSMTNRLNISTENDLAHMCEEIAPAVDYRNGKPTLQSPIGSTRAAAKRHISEQTTIQLLLLLMKNFYLSLMVPKGIEKLRQGKALLSSLRH